MRSLLFYDSAYFVLGLCTGADLKKMAYLLGAGRQLEAIFKLVSLAMGESNLSELSILNFGEDEVYLQCYSGSGLC